MGLSSRGVLESIAKIVGRKWLIALAVNDLFAVLFHAPGGVPRVHHELGVAGDGVVVIAGMIGGDQDAVVAGKAFGRQVDGAHVGKIVGAHFVGGGEVRIVVIEKSAAGGKQFKEFERGRFAKIVDILFIGHAKQKDFR